MKSILKWLMSLVKQFFGIILQSVMLSSAVKSNALVDMTQQPASSKDNSTQTIELAFGRGSLAPLPQLLPYAGSQPTERLNDDALISMLLDFNRIFKDYEIPQCISSKLDRLHTTYLELDNDLLLVLDSLFMQGYSDDLFTNEYLDRIRSVFFLSNDPLHDIDLLEFGQRVKWEYLNYAEHTEVFYLRVLEPNNYHAELLRLAKHLNKNVIIKLSEIKKKVAEVAIALKVITVRMWRIAGLGNDLRDNILNEAPERLLRHTISTIETCILYQMEEEKIFFLKLASWIYQIGLAIPENV